MSELTPRLVTPLIETAVLNELSRFANKIRSKIALGEIGPESFLFRLANVDQEGWSNPASKLNAHGLTKFIELNEVDLKSDEKAWLLFCILCEFIEPGKRPTSVLWTENHVFNGRYNCETQVGRSLIDLWLEIFDLEDVDDTGG